MGGVILHHAALPHRGGAVRVARLLMLAQAASGQDARLSFEVAENDPDDLAAPTTAAPTPADRFGPLLAATPEAVAHLHTSTDWPALLAGLLEHATGRRILLTLHDATPLTGGCAYPLDCPHFPACADPCPRAFPEARARQAETLALLQRLAPRLVSPSRWLAGLARQVLATLPVRVIPNGVPWPAQADLTGRAQARARLGVHPAAPMALFAAHGGARAAYKSGPQWPDFWNALRTRLGTLADPRTTGGQAPVGFAVGGDKTGGGGGLTIWPYVDRARLALLMRAADLLFYPALADNHPLVLLEAAGLELPVTAYAVGGVPEIVIPGETGLLAAPGDAERLVDAAAHLLADPQRCRTLGRTARARGGKRFSHLRMAADYVAVYEG